LVAFGLLRLVLLVFDTGMATRPYERDTGRPDWLRVSGRDEYPYAGGG
jgi:hypothetical protein